MSNQGSNSAKQLVEAEELEVDEPSMEEILASIRQIISDDEEAAALQDRDQYTHPVDHSNSNKFEEEADTSLKTDLEADLEAGIQVELEEAEGNPAATPAVAEVAKTEVAAAKPDVEVEVAKPQAEAAVPEVEAAKPEIEVQAEPSSLPVSEITEQAEAKAEQPEPSEKKTEIGSPEETEAAPVAALSIQDRAEQIRNELSDASSGLSVSDRLEKYRVRGKLKMETLAEKKPEPAPEPVVEQPAVSPAVAAGPVLPTTHSIAQKMAQTMLDEKEDEIQLLLANIMRPTIRKWLNENLPTMVEKLVREEIERVSRGKQAS